MAMWDMECLNKDCGHIETVLFSSTVEGLQEKDIKKYKCSVCESETQKLYTGKLHIWGYNDDESRDSIKMFGGGSRGINKSFVPYTKRKTLEEQTGLSYKQKIPLGCNFY
jgi:hypothetical protein